MPSNDSFNLRAFWSSKQPWDRALTLLFLAIILITIGAIVYVLTSSRTAEKFTEFYLLGQEGKAENYPRELYLGQEVSVIVGIVNSEYKPISYKLEIVEDDRKELELFPIALQHKEKWEQSVKFKASKVGTKQRVEFRLYREDDTSIYRSLYLWVNVNSSNLIP